VFFLQAQFQLLNYLQILIAEMAPGKGFKMTQPARFSDYINWGSLVSSGVIACKDGSLLGGWDVTGLDTESIEPEILDALTERLARGVAGFTNTDAFWVSLKRMPFGQLEKDPLTKPRLALDLIESERAALLESDGTVFTNAIHLMYQYLPEYNADNVNDDVIAFEKQCRLIEARLGGVLNLTRLKNNVTHDLDNERVEFDHLTGVLAQTLSGTARKVRIPTCIEHVYLDELLKIDFTQAGLNGNCFIDNKPIVTLSIDGYPSRFHRGALQSLEQLGFEYQWSTRYVCQSKAEAKSNVWKISRFWKQTAASVSAQVTKGGGGNRDIHADDMSFEATDVIRQLGRGDIGYGYYTSTITIFGKSGDSHDDLLQAQELVYTALLDAGFEARIERLNAFEAFLGSLPGHRHRNPRSVGLSNESLVDMIPIRTIWKGESYNPSRLFPNKSPALLQGRSQSGEIFNLNLHSGDVGHTLIFGPTSGGKSVLLGLLAVNFLKYQGAQIIYFDKKRSIQHATYALGGDFTAFGGADGRGVAPLRHMKTLGIDWTVSWLTELARLENVEITPSLAKEIITTVKNMINTPNVNFDMLANFVQDDELTMAFQSYSGGILDNEHADLEWSDVTVFETHELFDQSEKIAILALDYIFARVELRFDGRPTLLFIDEAWAYLKHPKFVERLRSWLKENRKSNVAVVLATQSISDAIDNPITPVLLESCFTKIFLPNAGAKTDEIKKQYKALGINDTQIDLISTLTPKQDYYVVQPEGQRVVDFVLGPATLSIVGSTSSEASKRAGELVKSDPNFWIKDVQSVLAQSM
jgi:type IV secretion/conjugal transfer VirB4 family ATPase